MTTDDQRPATDSSSRRHRFLWAALLVGACAVTYANSLTGAFTYDDKAVVRDNPRIRGPERLGDIFLTPYFGGPRGTGTAYRPLLLLSFAAQWWIHGGDVVAYHAANVLLHAAATLLLFRLLLCLPVPAPAASGAALLFAVHPVHVEAVTSVVGRGETQAAVFVFSYLLAALAVAARRRTLPALAGALACYILAALTKESAVVAPALAFLVLIVQGEGGLGSRIRFALIRGWPVYAGSAAALIGVFALRVFVLGGPLKNPSAGIYELENPLAPLPAFARVWNALPILVRYAGRTAFPVELTSDESAWSLPVLTGRSPVAWAAAALVAAATVSACARLGRRTLPAFGLLFFGVAFLPTANLLFPIGTIFAERLAYLPSAGLCVVLAAMVLGGSQGFGEVSRGRGLAFAAVVLLFAGRAAVRNTVWRTDEALFADSVRVSPGSAKAWYNDAFIAIERKDPKRGRDDARRATEIYANYWDAWAVKGRAERDLGLLPEAEASYAKSVALDPAYENGWYGLGMTREARGDLAGAEEAFARGLDRRAESFPLAYHLARIRTATKTPSAEAAWRRALELLAGSLPARNGYAGWLAEHGRDAEARRQWREALRRDAASLPALRGLAASDGRAGFGLGRCLALEKIFRLTNGPDDGAAREHACRGFRR